MFDEDVLVKDNFFDLELISQAWKECLDNDHKGQDFIDHHGIWKGQRVSRQQFIKKADTDISDGNNNFPPAIKKITDILLNEFADDISVREITFQQLYLPWDIHCDLTREDMNEKSIYKSKNNSEYVPFYNVLIPLHDVDSRTIIFDQKSTEYNDFWKFKKYNPKAINPVDESLWEEYLDMCWSEDREWLSIKKIMPPQQAGQLIAFRRHFFHSSDNFHKRNIANKHFLQFLLDKNA